MAKPKSKPQGYEFGRPTDYDPEYCKMLIDYFSVKPYEKIGDRLEANDFPTLAGFAISIDVDRNTLQNWAKKHKDFLSAYKRAKDYQENFLVHTAMKGLVNPAFAIFTAKNVIGWRDKVESLEESDDELEFT